MSTLHTGPQRIPGGPDGVVPAPRRRAPRDYAARFGRSSRRVLPGLLLAGAIGLVAHFAAVLAFPYALAVGFEVPLAHAAGAGRDQRRRRSGLEPARHPVLGPHRPQARDHPARAAPEPGDGRPDRRGRDRARGVHDGRRADLRRARRAPPRCRAPRRRADRGRHRGVRQLRHHRRGPGGQGDEREVSSAVATITVFGTAAVFVFPLVGHALDLDVLAAGLWAGAAVPDTAQTIAAGAGYSAVGRDVATVVKLRAQRPHGPAGAAARLGMEPARRRPRRAVAGHEAQRAEGVPLLPARLPGAGDRPLRAARRPRDDRRRRRGHAGVLRRGPGRPRHADPARAPARLGAASVRARVRHRGAARPAAASRRSSRSASDRRARRSRAPRTRACRGPGRRSASPAAANGFSGAFVQLSRQLPTRMGAPAGCARVDPVDGEHRPAHDARGGHAAARLGGR